MEVSGPADACGVVYASPASEGKKIGEEAGQGLEPNAKEQAVGFQAAKTADALERNAQATAEGRERLQRLLDSGAQAAAVAESFSADTAALRQQTSVEGPLGRVGLLFVLSLCLSVIVSVFLSFFPWGLLVGVLGFLAGGFALGDSRRDRHLIQGEGPHSNSV